jgi:hypothetical protein
VNSRGRGFDPRRETRFRLGMLRAKIALRHPQRMAGGGLPNSATSSAELRQPLISTRICRKIG